MFTNTTLGAHGTLRGLEKAPVVHAGDIVIHEKNSPLLFKKLEVAKVEFQAVGGGVYLESEDEVAPFLGPGTNVVIYCPGGPGHEDGDTAQSE